MPHDPEGRLDALLDETKRRGRRLRARRRVAASGAGALVLIVAATGLYFTLPRNPTVHVVGRPSPAPVTPIPIPTMGTVLGPGTVGPLKAGEPQQAAETAMEHLLGPPTSSVAGVCPGATELEWDDLSLEFSGGTFAGYRYNRGGWGALGSLHPPTATAVPALKTAEGATLGMTLSQVQKLYPQSEFSMEQGGTFVIDGPSGPMRLEFGSTDPAATLSEIKGGDTCGDV